MPAGLETIVSPCVGRLRAADATGSRRRGSVGERHDAEFDRNRTISTYRRFLATPGEILVPNGSPAFYAGISGYEKTQGRIEEVSMAKSEIDLDKGQTLEAMSQVVNQVLSEIKSKKHELAPMIQARCSPRPGPAAATLINPAVGAEGAARAVPGG